MGGNKLEFLDFLHVTTYAETYLKGIMAIRTAVLVPRATIRYVCPDDTEASAGYNKVSLDTLYGRFK
jgi:hypothetical protein